jgi:hypothetical protein
MEGGGTPDTTPPTNPSALSATPISISQISLSWTASTDAIGVSAYRIERCLGAGCSNFAEVSTSASTSYSDTGLATFTTYLYRVRAQDSAVNLSGYSNTASATTDPIATATTGIKRGMTSSGTKK